MDIIWYLLIIILIIFGFVISKYIRFDNYKILNMLKSLGHKSKTGLFLSLGTKIGVGSIIGTALSIYVGGAGSIFWIIIFMLLTSSLIYYESYIGNIYKSKKNNSIIGGPYFYISKCLNNKTLALSSLILLIFCYSFFFQMIQTNTITKILLINYNINIWIIATSFFLIILFLIFFSLNELLNTMNKLVPLMCFIYIFLGLTVVVINISDMGNIVSQILSSAFSKKGILVGAVIGIKRSIFLNEIMIGTSSTASSVDNIDPKTSARVQTLGVYFITLIVSLITSFLILIFNEHSVVEISSYNELISMVFKYHFGNIGVYILSIIIILFGITTIISGCYIGISNMEILTNNKKLIFIFRLLVLLFCMSGIFINTEIIWKLIDYIMYLLIAINLYSLYKIYRSNKNDRK